MTRRRPLAAVASLLVLACVYQLGAAPCGCLEHSGWRLAFFQDSQAVDGEQPTGYSDSHCEHAGWPPAIVGVRWLGQELGGDSAVGSAATLTADSPAGVATARTARERLTVFPAQQVRAALQVFRL